MKDNIPGAVTQYCSLSFSSEESYGVPEADERLKDSS